MVHVATARDFDFEPLRDSIHAFCAHPVGAPGKFIATLTIFPAGVQGGEHHFNARNFILRMNINWNAATIVADADGAIYVNGDFDSRAKIGEMFVD